MEMDRQHMGGLGFSPRCKRVMDKARKIFIVNPGNLLFLLKERQTIDWVLEINTLLNYVLIISIYPNLLGGEKQKNTYLL